MPLKTPFIEGNSFWKVRSSHGRKPLFESPEVLRDACQEYFDWYETHPLYETRISVVKGEVVKVKVPKMRAMSVGSLCIFLDMAIPTWSAYRNKSADFSKVCSEVEQIIYQQKFQGASADLLNHAIIARDLGLKDKQEHELSGQDGKPIGIRIKFVD